jgi:2-polyprenyl-6-methoxyphenol hydroxylase-like FAD-dependent oxidoreductase
MNTGMQDAYNLTWKLALVSRGICAPEPLLSSYSAERSAIAKLVLEATGKSYGNGRDEGRHQAVGS